MKERLLRPTGLSHFFFWRISCVCVCVCVCAGTQVLQIWSVCVCRKTALWDFFYSDFFLWFFLIHNSLRLVVCVCARRQTLCLFFFTYIIRMCVCAGGQRFWNLFCVFLCRMTPLWEFFLYFFYVCFVNSVCMLQDDNSLRGTPRCMMTWTLVCGEFFWVFFLCNLCFSSLYDDVDVGMWMQLRRLRHRRERRERGRERACVRAVCVVCVLTLVASSCRMCSLYMMRCLGKMCTCE